MSYMIQYTSRCLAKESGTNPEVYIYAIKVLLLNASSLGAIMFLAWLMGTLKITLIVWAAFFSLRIFTGGRHQPGPLICWLSTVGAFTAMGYLITLTPPQVYDYAHLVTALSLILVAYAVIMHAPVTIASKDFSPKKRRRLKMAALCVLICWTTFLLTPIPILSTTDQIIHLGIIVGLVTQSISVIPFICTRGTPRGTSS